MFKAKAPNIFKPKKGISGSLGKSLIKEPTMGRKGALGIVGKDSKPEDKTNVSTPICQGAAVCPECGENMSHSHKNDYDDDGD